MSVHLLSTCAGARRSADALCRISLTSSSSIPHYHTTTAHGPGHRHDHHHQPPTRRTNRHNQGKNTHVIILNHSFNPAFRAFRICLMMDTILCSPRLPLSSSGKNGRNEYKSSRCRYRLQLSSCRLVAEWENLLPPCARTHAQLGCLPLHCCLRLLACLLALVLVRAYRAPASLSPPAEHSANQPARRSVKLAGLHARCNITFDTWQVLRFPSMK